MPIVYHQTGITLHHGESLSLLLEMESESADGFLTDPPYSSGGQFRGDRAQGTRDKYSLTGTATRYPEFDGDTRDQRAFLAWSTLWLDQAERITKPGGFLGVFADWRQLGVMIDAVQAGGGTTLMACRELGLQCIGIERNSAQAAMAAERLAVAEQTRLNLEGAFS